MPVRNPPSPKELQCLGMKLADFNILFRRGYCELSVNYKKVRKPDDPALCDKFLDALRKGPNEMMKAA